MRLPLLMGICAHRSVIILITMDYEFDPKMDEYIKLYRCKLTQQNYYPPFFNYQFKDCFIKSWLDMQKNLE